MITILHGENTVASRNELDKIKSDFVGEIVFLEGKNLSENNFIQATQSQSLLSDNKLVIIENYLSDKNRGDKIFKKFSGDIVFWDDKELGKTILNNFKEAKILLSKIDTVIFKFCDSLLPGNRNKTVDLFRTCLKNTETEYIFAMIVRQFRMMLNPTSLSPWQQSKIVVQAKAFGSTRLVEIYKQLLELDYQNKTGQLPKNLSFSIELLLLNL